MFKAIKNSLNSLGEMLDNHYAKQIEKDLKKGKVLDHRRPFGQVLDEDILVNRGNTNENHYMSNSNSNSNRNEPSIEVGRYRGGMTYGYQNALPIDVALKLLESKIADFRVSIRDEYANRGCIDLRVFAVDKNEVSQLGNLTWSEMLKFSRENKTILGLKADCEKRGIHCFVKEKAGRLTLICCSNKSIYDREVDKLVSSYKM